jgi:hypothetical protein
MRVAAAALLLAFAGAARAQAPFPAGFGWLPELAGACWRAERASAKGIDTQCYERQFGRFIRGTIRIYDEHGTLVTEGDSVFAAEARTQRVLYSQWASNGAYGTGELKVDGKALRFTAGAQAKVRYTWTRPDADSYRVVRERRDDAGAWKEDSNVLYRRVAG